MFVNMAKSCPSQEFLMSQICLLTLFVKINSRENFEFKVVGYTVPNLVLPQHISRAVKHDF